jgi:protein SCO1/2
MNARHKNSRLLWLFLPLAVVLGLVVASWMRQAPAPVAEAGGNALLEQGMQIDASLTGLLDPRGRPVDERQFEGRLRLVAFGFTFCPDICPTMLFGVKEGLEQLGDDAAQVAPIFISVDPQRDTPERVGVYVSSFDARILGLSGSAEALARVAGNYKVYYEKRGMGEARDAYTIDHTSMLYLIDAQQRIRALIATDAGPQRVAEDIVAAYHAVRAGKF